MRWWIALVLMGCTPSDGNGPTNAASDTDDTNTTEVSDTDTDGVTDTDTDTDPGTETLPWERDDLDCANLPGLPASFTTTTWNDPHEDFTFSNDGMLIGLFAGALQAMPWGGPRQVLVPGLNDVRGTRFLPDGRLALADSTSQALRIVDLSNGSSVVVAGGLTNPNGIAIGYDGWVYITVSGRVIRVEPDTGEVQVVVDMPGRSFDGITFSPDYRYLYFNEEFGAIHRVEIDTDGTPLEPILTMNLPVGVMSILDGMAADACGNVYTIEMGGTVWRMTPDGELDIAVTLTGVASFIPSLNFGPGVGGYESETLYVMDFLGKLHAVPLGVPGKWEPHQPVP